MTRRVLPPSQADVLRSLDERLGRLERQKFPEPAPQPLVAGGGGGGGATIYYASNLDEAGADAGDQTTDMPGRLNFSLPSAGVVKISAGLYVTISQFDGVLDGLRTLMWLVDHNANEEYRSQGYGFTSGGGRGVYGFPPSLEATLPFSWTGVLEAGSYSFGMRVYTSTQGSTNSPIMLIGLWLDAVAGLADE